MQSRGVEGQGSKEEELFTPYSLLLTPYPLLPLPDFLPGRSCILYITDGL